MEIHQLRYFSAIAETGSFTRAAARENVAQPSLSQQVIKLEEELGAKLFDRMGRQVRLTESGAAFLPRAQAILRDIGAAKDQIQDMTGSDRGLVRIGAIPTVAPYFLPRVLPGFTRRYPSIKIAVMEDITSVLLEQLQQGALDAALLALPAGGPEFTFFELERERLMLVLPARHKLAKRRSISLQQIANDPFLLLKDGHCFRETAVSACQNARVKPNVVFESGNFVSIIGMVAAGVGVSIVPESAMEKRKGCKYLPIDDERAFRRIGQIYATRHFKTRAQLALIDYLKKLRKE